uniref:afadin- and alpha-actinin-binding protein isoform X2 n=1 Tax=Scatophagus argus TaxID=75038 RepID=UPI001ED83E9F|nr:afadin- and alpha-actinin-binding protein isoform X2 [Scatophagus argus]
MASRIGQIRAGRCLESSDSYLLGDLSSNSMNELFHSESWWANSKERREQGDSLREQLKEMDEHVSRLQDMLRSEQAKVNCTLQRNQQEAELRRREQHINRLKERLSLLSDRHREKGPSIEVLNFPTRGRGKREQVVRSLRSTAKREEATLRLMLERREAELREAMKLRHSLTTLLHALRVDMEHTLSDAVEVQHEARTEDKRLDQAEVALGDHVTGGVVQSWRQVQQRLVEVLPEGHTGVGTDHDKLLARLETDLKESQQLVRLQQQLLQDSLSSPVPTELTDSYFLEEWERLKSRWAEFDYQRRTFERERKSFTDAAIRLSHERRDFEQQKASLLKQQYLCNSPQLGKRPPHSSRRESTALSLGPTSMSGCLPITPSSTKSGAAAVSGLDRGRAGVPSPNTPELYSALSLSYNCRSSEVDHQSETWDGQADGMIHSPQAPHLDYNFDDWW